MEDRIMARDLAVMCGMHVSNVTHLLNRGIISAPTGMIRNRRHRYWTPTAAAANVVAVEAYRKSKILPAASAEVRAFYENNLPLVYKASRRWVPRGIDVEDWQQECALNVLRNLHSFDATKGAFSTWCYRVCWSIAVEFVRMERTRKALAAQSLHVRGADGESYTIDIEDHRQPDPARAAAHLVDDVRQGLRSLPARAQEVVMSRVDEEPERAIGRRIGITRQRVDQIWKQSKRKLANVMASMGYDEGAE